MQGATNAASAGKKEESKIPVESIGLFSADKINSKRRQRKTNLTALLNGKDTSDVLSIEDLSCKNDAQKDD